MLSASALPYIQASVPVLREQGVAITRRFYAQMFAAHPELKNLFNLGNQASGAQQGALAAAVVAYAANVQNPAALGPVIERIAHKHASLGIKPAHYPIVARHLLGAIRDVLGTAATPELLAAWDEAYWLLAGELIAAEARLYDRAMVEPGALSTLRIAELRRESEDVVSYYLESERGGSPGPFRPGQYVSVALELPGEGLRQLRQYSLSDAPSRPYWRISVKREREGQGAPAGRISNLLHETKRRGDLLQVSAAFGEFAPKLDDEGPLALLSAGVGVTPMMSMLNALADQGSHRPLLFAHAARTREHHVLREELDQAQAWLPNLTACAFYEEAVVPHEQCGRMALAPELIAPFREAEFYLCGPLAFMREQWRSLIALGISPTRLHREVFGPELLDHLL